MESLAGNPGRIDHVLVSPGGTNTWSITGPNDGTLGSVTFTDFNTLRTGTGDDTFNVPVSYTGSVQIRGNATWNYSPGARLGSTVTSTAGPMNVSLTIPAATGANVDVAPADLNLPNLTGFRGHLIIGGTLTPATLPITGGTALVVNADKLTVDSPIDAGGAVTLLASNIDLNADVSAGGSGGEQIALIAVGDSNGGTAPGNITALNNVTVSGGSGVLIANNTIVNPQQVDLLLGGGSLQVAVSATAEDPQFDLNSDFAGIDLTSDISAFIANAGIDVQGRVLFTSNPGAQLVQQQLLGFVDVGVFSKELTLFGVIGNGIALALDQCEDLQGCAPNVNEKQLAQLISDLQARISELEKRRSEGKISKAEADKLLAGYREKLKNFQEYRVKLKQYLEQQNAGGGFGGEDFGPIPGPGPGPGPGDEGPGPAGPEAAPAPGPSSQDMREEKMDDEITKPSEPAARPPGNVAPIQASTLRTIFGTLAWDDRGAMPVRHQRY